MRGKTLWATLGAAIFVIASVVTTCLTLGLATGANAQTTAVTNGCPYSDILLAHADGAVTLIGSSTTLCGISPFRGSMAGVHLNAPIVGMAATPDGQGYWLVAADGGIFTFGDAHFFGSLGAIHLNAPIVGMAATPDGQGYWLAGADGGVFSFGDAVFYGSMGGVQTHSPFVAITADGTTGGYWLTAANGSVSGYNAPFLGSLLGTKLNAPIRFMTATADFGGYRMVGADGGVFDFGDAQYFGSAAAPGSSGWDALSTSASGGYWLFASTPSGAVSYLAFGNAASPLTGIGGDSSSATIVGAATFGTQISSPNPTPSPNGPAITTQPSSETVAPGATASFFAAASGTPPPSVQWQVSTNAGASYANIANATTSTLTFETVQSENGGLYRAVFTNASGSTATSSATLTVGNAPDVTLDPVSQQVNAGDVATFTAAATGSPAPTVVWEVSTNSGSTFTEIPGADTTTLSITTASTNNGDEYEAIFTNSSGSVETSIATLTVVS